MKTAIAFMLACVAVLTNFAQAATIHLIKDELDLSAAVSWPEPNTPFYQETYSGSVFGTAMVPINPRINADGGIFCDGGQNYDGQSAWTMVMVEAGTSSVRGGAFTSEHYEPPGCDEYNAWGHSTLSLDWGFKVNGEGAAFDIRSDGYVGSSSRPDLIFSSSYSLFDETTDTLVASVINDHFQVAGSPIDLIDSHRYTLRLDLSLASSFDADPGLHFDFEFQNATIVPEPETLAVFGLGLAGLFLTTRVKRHKPALAKVTHHEQNLNRKG